MFIDILYFDAPTPAYNKAKSFLEKNPLLNNVNLTLLEERIKHPKPGRYWVCLQDHQVVGIGLQSPLNYGLNLSPMEEEVLAELVTFIANQKLDIPYVNGDSHSTTLFAGLWTEQHNLGALPNLGLRLYEKEHPHLAAYNNGCIRQAIKTDLKVLVTFMEEFNEEIGEEGVNIDAVVKERIEEGRFWLWEHNQQAVSYLCLSNPVVGVVRIQMVYTARAARGHHYAKACTNVISNMLLQQGHRVMLFTDLSNPISNFVFRTIGFKAKAACLKYTFISK